MWGMCKLSTPAAPLVLSASCHHHILAVPSISATVKGATSFNGDVSQWDVGRVENMLEMCKLSTPAAPLVLSRLRRRLLLDEALRDRSPKFEVG